MKIVLENHGKVYKVFRIDPSKHDGKNRTLLGKFKSADDAVRFMNNL